jgi:hypothetical protein
MQAHWRAAVHEAATSSQGIWKLAKWARTKSHLPKEPAKMPNLRWNRSLITTVNEKAAALQERFYPTAAADLTDITDPSLEGEALATELQIDRTAVEWEVYRALKSTKPDKCLGVDEILNQFLLAIGQPLVQALSMLLNRCWAAEYYLKQFQTACTIVLWKPNKRDYLDLSA